MVQFSFLQNIEREFGKGVKPRGLAKVEEDIRNKKNAVKKWAERFERDNDNYKKDPKNESFKQSIEESMLRFDRAQKDYENAKEALYTGDVFSTNTPDKTIGLISCKGELNLADLYDIRFDTDNKTARIVVENYNDTQALSEIQEGENIPYNDIREYVKVIKTNRENIKKIAGILNVPETMLNDERDLLNGAIDSIQGKHTGNTETVLLCKAIRTSKEAVKLDTVSFSTTVNNSLSAKAKLGAEIITNESGFNKLDVLDSNGNPLLKKDFRIGEFVYMDKYIVRTLSDDILENNEDNSAPIFIGDWRNVLRIATVKKYPPLFKHNIFDCLYENRAIKHIIPILTTTSDKAFIVGYIE